MSSVKDEEEKYYNLTFEDGTVRRMEGKLSELQKIANVVKIEEAPPSPLLKILPMPPLEGPPFPRGLNLKWPGR